jgi:hypothetical protein
MSCGAEEPFGEPLCPFLFLGFELPDERREPRGNGGRQGVVSIRPKADTHRAR